MHYSEQLFSKATVPGAEWVLMTLPWGNECVAGNVISGGHE